MSISLGIWRSLLLLNKKIYPGWSGKTQNVSTFNLQKNFNTFRNDAHSNEHLLKSDQVLCCDVAVLGYAKRKLRAVNSG